MNDTHRTQGILIRSANGEPAFLLGEHETVRTYEDGSARRLEYRETRRNLTEIADAPLPCGKVTIATVGELLAVITGCADAFDGTDREAKAERDAQRLKQEAAAQAQAARLEEAASAVKPAAEGTP